LQTVWDGIFFFLQLTIHLQQPANKGRLLFVDH